METPMEDPKPSPQAAPAKPVPVNWTNMLLFTLTPLLAVVLVPLYGFTYGYEWFEWLMMVLMMGVCGMSITAGYHRLWAHKAYKAHPVVRLLFAIGGACALQNDILNWVSDHRRHHQFVDDNERDPYSAGRGLWFSHMGWILRHYPSGRDDFSNVKDLERDPIVRWQARNYLTLVLATNIGIPLLLGWLYGDIIASLLLAGLLRLVLSQHVTWLINSAAHRWGAQPYSRDNSARDSSLLALFTYGEGYHNYHHAFQWDYRMGIRWWHFDPTKWMIRALSWLRLTRDLKRCPPARVEKTRLAMQYASALSHCELLNLPEKIRSRLRQEYEQLQHTLQLWAEHRQAWYEIKRKRLHETLEQWDRLALRDRCQELQFRLRTQRRRWRQLLRSLTQPLPTAAGSAASVLATLLLSAALSMLGSERVTAANAAASTGADAESTAGASSTASGTASNTEGPDGAIKGEIAPDFTLPSLYEDQPPITLSDLRGKTVYLDFWASWCAPCIISLPLYNDLYHKYKERGLEVVGVNVDNPPEDGLDFLLDTPLDFLIPADTDGSISALFGVEGMPTSYLIAPDGTVLMVHAGFRGGDIAEIEAAIEEALPSP